MNYFSLKVENNFWIIIPFQILCLFSSFTSALRYIKSWDKIKNSKIESNPSKTFLNILFIRLEASLWFFL